ncbi:hypothetical protein GCM10010912_51800 [Paenibacillus albidus]|uniref:Uncharacterized protein n=1 Tax=Paenibacillus albidus TaxID=2041023 RepID=A0A917FRZ9_9BACL|nr:hypothetical protein GCM10010912_51800 [Paenibacillus albidus]
MSVFVLPCGNFFVARTKLYTYTTIVANYNRGLDLSYKTYERIDEKGEPDD